jgi:hypothetical protein
LQPTPDGQGFNPYNAHPVGWFINTFAPALNWAHGVATVVSDNVKPATDCDAPMVSQLSYCRAGMNPKILPFTCAPRFEPKAKSLCHAGVDVEFSTKGCVASPEMEDKKSDALFVWR